MPKRRRNDYSNPRIGQLSPECQTHIADVPAAPTGVHQGGRALEASLEDLGINQAGTMLSRFGAAQRRRPTSTYSYLMDRQIKPSFRPVLRLRYRMPLCSCVECNDN